MSVDEQLILESLSAYDIGGELGRGGCGVVLAGRHRLLDRDVAIKQLPSAFARDAAVRARFTTEARLLASLDHPHVVPVYDFVERDGLCLLVLEMLPGGTVWSRFTSTGFTAPAAVAVALASSAGLKAAHEHGILHRDVKPDNLMFSATGWLKVTDFGIATVVGGAETLSTRAGKILGTPAYIAPEQARGQTVSPATDIYALSVVLYELLAGALPFADDGDAMSLLFKHAFESPVPLSDVAPAVPPGLAAVVMRGLARDPADRFDSAEEFGVGLARASTAAWGPGWLSREGLPVMGADRIILATQGERGQQTSSSTSADQALPPPPVGVEDFLSQRRSATASATVIRPAAGAHVQGAVLAELAESDLVPVQKVLVLPKPGHAYLVAAGLCVLAVIIAVIGVGSPPRGGTVRGGTVTLAGRDPSVASAIPIDLTAPLRVTARRLASAGTVTLTLRAAGFEVAHSAAPLQRQGLVLVATLPPLGGQYLVTGRLTGALTFSRASVVLATEQFPVRTTQPALVSAATAVVLVMFLFGLAYLESNLRALRRTRRRVGPTLGAALSAAVLGVAMVGAASSLAERPALFSTMVAAAAFGTLSGVAVSVGATRGARRRRQLKGDQAEQIWRSLTGRDDERRMAG